MEKGEDSMNKNLEELARKAKNEYFRKYRAANKDKIKQHQKAYWERQAEKKLKEQGDQ